MFGSSIPPVVSRRAHFYCVFCVYLRIMMSNISSYLMTLCSELRVVMSTMISAIKTMFGSSLPSLVCRRAHVLFMLFVLGMHSDVQHVLTIWVIWWVWYKRQELLTLCEHLDPPWVFGGSVLLIVLVFYLVFLLCLSSSCVLCAQCF
jgi:hypothetical protein